MAAPTWHLMWKEYRTLRPVWLLAVGVASPFFLLGMISVVNGSKVFTWNDILADGIYVNLLAAALFVPVALCMAFTLETEERTSPLLFQLAPTWRQMMLGKLVPIAVATLALLATLALIESAIAALVALTTSVQFRWAELSSIAFRWPNSVPIWYVVSLILLPIVCSLCWAMTLRKVMTAVIATLLSWPVMAFVLTVLESKNFGDAFFQGTLLASLGIVTLMSIAWHRGILPYDLSVSLTSLVGGHSTVDSSLIDNVSRPSFLTPVRRLFSWLQRPHWIARISRQQESTGRMARALLWKEVRTVTPFVLVWCVLAVALLFLSDTALPATRVSLLTFLGALFFQECGLRAYRTEHRDGTLLFGAHQGVSPTLTWFVKVGSWLAACRSCCLPSFPNSSFLICPYRNLSGQSFWQPQQRRC